MNNLAAKSLIGQAQLIIVLAVLLFLPAWSFNYWQAWVFLLVFSISVFFITLFFLREDPKLIESRLKAGPGAEQQTSQKIVQALASIFFILPFIIASLDHRFGWSNIQTYLVIVGDLLVALGLFFVFLVFRENTFTSATIELREEQHMISTEP